MVHIIQWVQPLYSFLQYLHSDCQTFQEFNKNFFVIYNIYNTEYFPFDLMLFSYLLSITILSSISILLCVIKGLTGFQKRLLLKFIIYTIYLLIIPSYQVISLSFFILEIRLTFHLFISQEIFSRMPFQVFSLLDLFIISLLNFFAKFLSHEVDLITSDSLKL